MKVSGQKSNKTVPNVSWLMPVLFHTQYHGERPTSNFPCWLLQVDFLYAFVFGATSWQEIRRESDAL